MSDQIAEFLDHFPDATWASTGDEAAAVIRERLAPEFAAAEARGYDRAIANLLDRAKFSDYRQQQMTADSFLSEGQRFGAAVYLEAVKDQP